MSLHSQQQPDSPFLKAPQSSWVASNQLAFAIPDHFPVSPGHTLVVTRRVVPTWFDATSQEQTAMMEMVRAVKEHLDGSLSPKPDGYNVGFNSGSAAGQTVPHVHIHVIPRYTGDMDDPRGGVRHVIPWKGNYLNTSSRSLMPRDSKTCELTQDVLFTGHPHSPLWPALEWRIQTAHTIDVLASFVQVSGLELIRPALFGALRNGAKVRILVGDYLYISDQKALRILYGWNALVADQAGQFGSAAFEARLTEVGRLPDKPTSFHPKSWHIVDTDGAVLVVGSSNLSQSALRDGLEWNLLVSGAASTAAREDAVTGFNRLWEASSLLTPSLLDAYEKAASAFSRTQFSPSPTEVAEPPPNPRPWQVQALKALFEMRAQGIERALVTVATGMGKTWLAAFDVLTFAKDLKRRPRVLVIAHRSHILAQAERTLNRVLESTFGNGGTSWFLAQENDISGDLVLASVQKLSRSEGLSRLQAESFDYTLIDEVHHVEAPSYRRVLARLKTRFVLGLTATPERSDGLDVVSIFDDNLAYSAGIGDGIEEGALVPFNYIGIKDTVDFAQIPWRNGRFDLVLLEQELLQSSRMKRLGDALNKHPAGRTLFFCVSRRHALFTRDWLRTQGHSAAAVFSGSGGDSYGQSLSGLQDGVIESLCVVDMFNEGLDIPAVERVVMLRPTESKIVFLQQLGRGLRASPNKKQLTVIDFVGNHRIFAQRIIHLLSLRRGHAGVDQLRRWIEQGEADLPEGCLLDVELEAKDMLHRLLPTGRVAAMEGYRALRDELGRRPLMLEVYNRGFLPKALGKAQGGWLNFLRTEGDLEQGETAALAHLSGWFAALEESSLNKSYKMIVIRVLLDLGVLWCGIGVMELAVACRRFLRTHTILSRDLDGEGHAINHHDASEEEWAAWWQRWPVERWLVPFKGERWFTLTGQLFKFQGDCPEGLRSAVEVLSAEIVDYRLAHYAKNRGMIASVGLAGTERYSASFVCKVSHSNRTPILRLPDRSKFPEIPWGPTPVRLPDGSELKFKFVKVAVNGAFFENKEQNRLPELLRGWFGPQAGLPGTDFKVRLELRKNVWSAFPDGNSYGSDSLYEHNEDQGASLRVAEPRGEPST